MTQTEQDDRQTPPEPGSRRRLVLFGAVVAGLTLAIAAVCVAIYLKLADSSARRQEQAPMIQGTGRFVVEGTGTDLFYVHSLSGDRVSYTRTNSDIELEPGHYTVLVNASSQEIEVRAGEETRIKLSAVTVKGISQDLFEVYDAEVKKKLQFKHTNKQIELIPGIYAVSMHGSARRIKLFPGEIRVLEAGLLSATGGDCALYDVYDETGTRKLDSRSAGQKVELLPGTYTVVCGDQRWVKEVFAGRLTTVSAY